MPEDARPGADATQTVRLPLEGLRGLDLTLARAGPTCVRPLADRGAEVIRIEPPGAQDGSGSAHALRPHPRHPRGVRGPQLRHLGMVRELPHERLGRAGVLRTPLTIEGHAPGIHRPVPALGAHAEEILAEAGLTPAGIAALREAKALGKGRAWSSPTAGSSPARRTAWARWCSTSPRSATR